MRWTGLGDRIQALLRLVAERMAEGPETTPARRHRLSGRLYGVVGGPKAWRDLLGFIGQTGAAIGEVLIRPRRLRRRELFVQLRSVGLDAVDIVSMMTLLIGVVFAYLLAPPMGSALVALEASLLKRENASQIGRQVFVALTPVARAESGAAADAMSEATNQVLDDIVLWIDSLLSR